MATSVRKLPHYSANPAGGACTLWVKCAKEADKNTVFFITQLTALVDSCIIFSFRFKHPILIYKTFIVPGLS